jgi:hypothetical protein
MVVDHPFPNENFLCIDDGFYSVASFTAYLSSGVAVRGEARANNEIVSFAFTLGSSATSAGISRVAVQVCRFPLSGTRPAYCGPAQHYAPVVYDPPGAAA